MTLCNVGPTDFLSNIVHLFNVGSMLGQRRRRWPSIKTALDQCPVKVVSCNQFSGYINAVNLYSIGYCWPTLDRPRHARLAVESFFNGGPLIYIYSTVLKIYNLFYAESAQNIYYKTILAPSPWRWNGGTLMSYDIWGKPCRCDRTNYFQQRLNPIGIK